MADPNHYHDERKYVEERKSGGTIAFIVGGLVVAVALILFWIFGGFDFSGGTTAETGTSDININATSDSAAGAASDPAAGSAGTDAEAGATSGATTEGGDAAATVGTDANN